MSSTWGSFDAIWCINYAEYRDRRNRVSDELRRVGILGRRNFFWKITHGSVFDRILFDTTKRISANDCRSVGIMNLAIGHYSCIKSSYDMGHERILILEDDVSMLRDCARIADFISSIPKDADIVTFSHNPCNDDALERYVANERLGETEKFLPMDFVIYDSSFYMLSRKAMAAVISAYEMRLSAADHYISGEIRFNGLKSYYSSTPLSVQYESGSSISGYHSGTYASMGLDLADYGIPFPSVNGSDEILFRLVIPMHNAEETIGRCIRSIKRQKHGRFFAVIVDDCSTDGSVSEAEREIGTDERFIVVRSDKHVFGGEARNIALRIPLKSDYTLFIDADDEYHSPHSMDVVAYAIVNDGFPDYVLCPFISSSDGKITQLRYSNIDSYIRDSPVFAPWTACVKSTIAAEFSEGVGYDDVIQHFRQLDRSETMARADGIIVRYNCDGKTSFWNDKKMCNEKIELKERSLVATVGHALSERFSKTSVMQSIRVNFIDHHIKEAIALKSKYGI